MYMYSIICGILRCAICTYYLFAARVCNAVDVFGLLAIFFFHYVTKYDASSVSLMCPSGFSCVL